MIEHVAWAVWLVVSLAGLLLFFLRSSETGLSYVNLPRLLYFFWVGGCVMLMSTSVSPVVSMWCLVGALVVGFYAMVGDEPLRGGRRKEVVERVKGCRRALELDERNPASLEMLGDVYSTLEDAGLALRYWERSYAIASRAKVLEKIESVKRDVPMFPLWGDPCTAELRACPGCELVVSRLAYSCRCGEVFFMERATWLAVRFNRAWETTGAGTAVETGLALLPFLFWCEPWAYGVAWLLWLGARRESPDAARSNSTDYGADRGRAFFRVVAILVLLGTWSVRAGWAPPPTIIWTPKRGRPDTWAPKRGRPASVSAKVSWQTTP